MIKVAINQPYFFPYPGYFSLIKSVDRFILFDTVQFIRHGWIDRNRILKQNDGWLYIRPTLVGFHHGTLIKDVLIDNSTGWQQKLLAQLVTYRKAPHYRPTRRLIENILGPTHASLVDLNKALLEGVCAYLGMPRSLEVFSRMGLQVDQAKEPDEWALSICRSLGDVHEYWNPIGGKAFFDRSKYENASIALRFHHAALESYDQGRAPFEPALSIVDAMMFLPPDEILAALDRYTLS